MCNIQTKWYKILASWHKNAVFHCRLRRIWLHLFSDTTCCKCDSQLDTNLEERPSEISIRSLRWWSIVNYFYEEVIPTISFKSQQKFSFSPRIFWLDLFHLAHPTQLFLLLQTYPRSISPKIFFNVCKRVSDLLWLVYMVWAYLNQLFICSWISKGVHPWAL